MTSHCLGLVYYTMVMMEKKKVDIDDHYKILSHYMVDIIPWKMIYNDNIHHIMGIDHYNGINYNDGYYYYDYQRWIHNYDILWLFLMINQWIMMMR